MPRSNISFSAQTHTRPCSYHQVPQLEHRGIVQMLSIKFKPYFLSFYVADSTTQSAYSDPARLQDTKIHVLTCTQ